MTDETKEIVSLIIKNWKDIKKISSPLWKKIKGLFEKGDRSLGFIRRKDLFLNYLAVSQKTFVKKYAKHIIPIEYRGYLLQSMILSELYKQKKTEIANKKRSELNKINPKALRIYNLYNSSVLNTVFSQIDKSLKEGLKEAEITGKASRLLDDLINDNAIIYINQFTDSDAAYSKVKLQLKTKNYCLIYGSGNTNITKIKEILNAIVDDLEVSRFSIEHDKRVIGNVHHFSVFIYEKAFIQEE